MNDVFPSDQHTVELVRSAVVALALERGGSPEFSEHELVARVGLKPLRVGWALEELRREGLVEERGVTVAHEVVWFVTEAGRQYALAHGPVGGGEAREC
jgi:hypothetical protein